MRSALGVSQTHCETTLVAVIAIDPGMKTAIVVVTLTMRAERRQSKVVELFGQLASLLLVTKNIPTRFGCICCASLRSQYASNDTDSRSR